MKKLLPILLIFSIYAGVPSNFESRFVGIVSEVKLISLDEDNNTVFLVKANQSYFIKGVKHIPYIYIGDSLFEYWSDFRKIGVGTRKKLTIYEISNDGCTFYLK